jgi:predicted ATPase
MGLLSGFAQEAAATGETLNLASRLEALANANTVVISDETHALASGLFDYELLGPQSLKGIDGTPEVWRVVGERRVESRFAAAHGAELTPLIGREEELDLLKRRWQRSIDSEGQVVLLAGEPGIGKSRLSRALQDSIGGDPHTRVLLQCSPHYTSSALYPVINQLEFAARFQSGDDPATRLDKLSSLLSQGGQPTDEEMALVASLLSIPADERYPLPKLTPQQQKDRTLTALNDHLAGLAAEKPVLFVLEDAHWIDPTTLELMELAIERIRDLPVLIVVTYRPEFSAPWVGEDHVTLLALNRLSRKERALMADALIGELGLPTEALAQIAERSDGIPLFIEELTKSVREAGIESVGSEDYAAATGIDIPATLQDALEARFDRSPAVREVVQVGAAIGRAFPYDLLALVTALSPTELVAALDELTDSGLIFARGTPPDASYTFKHALIQDTAYDSMVRSKRQDTHKRIVQNLLSLRPEISDAEPETLAHHYTEARVLDAAIDWWTRAGQSASARSANPEAVALLDRGLQIVTELPESETRDRRELAIQTALFGPLISVRGQFSDELETAFTKALELSEKVDAPEEQFRALFAKSLSYGTRGQHLLANRAAKDLLQRGERASDQGAILMGHRQLAMSLFLLGQVEKAQEHIDIVLSQFDRSTHGHVMVAYGQDIEVVAEGYNAISQWVLGWPNKARAASDRSIERALALDHVSSIGPVLSWAGHIVSAISRDSEGLQRTCENFRSITSQQGSPIWETVERISNALVENMRNPTHQTAAELRAALEYYESINRNGMFYPLYWGGFLADCYLSICEPESALDAIEKGLKFAEDSNENWSNAELYRMHGVALAVRDGAAAHDEAEALFRHAIKDAQTRQAKSLELRAATSLAQMMLDQDRTVEAHEILSPVYSWFTEGFDTPDLIDAKSLLDEIS